MSVDPYFRTPYVSRTPPPVGTRVLAALDVPKMAAMGVAEPGGSFHSSRTGSPLASFRALLGGTDLS